MGVSLDLANAELQRGIDEQSTRLASRLGVVAFLVAASVGSTAQLLATTHGQPGWRFAALALSAVSVGLALVADHFNVCFDISPATRLADAATRGLDEDEFKKELVIARVVAYGANEVALTDRGAGLLAFRAAVGVAGSSTVLALVLMLSTSM